MKQLKKVTLTLILDLLELPFNRKVEKSISSNDNQKAENNLAEKPNSTSGAPKPRLVDFGKDTDKAIVVP